jgi:hypothetical protein
MADRVHDPTVRVYWFDVKTQTPTTIPVGEASTGQLLSILFAFGRAMPTVDHIRAVVGELRARQKDGRETYGGRTLATMNRWDPPPCACGRVGLYIVSQTTYCRRCKPQAVQRRSNGIVKYHDAVSRDLQDVLDARDKNLRKAQCRIHARFSRNS